MILKNEYKDIQGKEETAKEPQKGLRYFLTKKRIKWALLTVLALG
jgi:hypothetical protein